MREKLFTIKQYADLHDIGRRTLHFYDEIGLFSPQVKAENGYRYYTLGQSPHLDMILTLRELDVPLDTIKAYMQNRNKDSLKDLLATKTKEVDIKLKNLKDIKSLLLNKQEQLDLIPEDVNGIGVVETKAMNYILTILTEDNISNAMFQHVSKLPHHLFNMEIGTITKVENLYNGAYHYTYGIISNSTSKTSNYRRDKGKYLRAYHQGNFNDIHETYQRIMDYCKLNNIELEGYAYELAINILCIMKKSETIIMIEIKVKE